MSPPVVEQIIASMKCIMGEDGTTVGEWVWRTSLPMAFMDLCVVTHTTTRDRYRHGGSRVPVDPHIWWFVFSRPMTIKPLLLFLGSFRECVLL